MAALRAPRRARRALRPQRRGQALRFWCCHAAGARFHARAASADPIFPNGVCLRLNSGATLCSAAFSRLGLVAALWRGDKRFCRCMAGPVSLFATVVVGWTAVPCGESPTDQRPPSPADGAIKTSPYCGTELAVRDVVVEAASCVERDGSCCRS